MFKESETTIYEMPFSFNAKLEYLEKYPCCRVCGIQFGSKVPPEVHSASTFHFEKGTIRDPHLGYVYLLGRGMDLRLWQELGGEDGVPLCLTCHDLIHEAAILEEKLRNPNFNGDVASPGVLIYVTSQAIKRGKW